MLHYFLLFCFCQTRFWSKFSTSKDEQNGQSNVWNDIVSQTRNKMIKVWNFSIRKIKVYSIPTVSLSLNFLSIFNQSTNHWEIIEENKKKFHTFQPIKRTLDIAKQMLSTIYFIIGWAIHQVCSIRSCLVVYDGPFIGRPLSRIIWKKKVFIWNKHNRTENNKTSTQS